MAGGSGNDIQGRYKTTACAIPGIAGTRPLPSKGQEWMTGEGEQFYRRERTGSVLGGPSYISGYWMAGFGNQSSGSGQIARRRWGHFS